MSDFGWGLSERDIVTVPVSATDDGANTIIAAPGVGKYIVVLGYAVNLNAPGAIVLATTGGAPLAPFEFPDGGGASFAGGPKCPAFILPENVGLRVTNPAGVDTTGHLAYVVVQR